MSRSKPLVSQLRNYLVTTVAQAKTITTEWLADIQLDKVIALGLPEVDDRYHIWRVPLCNAGGTLPVSAMDTSEEFFETALRFNVTAAFLLSKLAARAMVDTGGSGAIVNISSRSSDMVMTSFVAYGTAKAALNMMTRNMAADLAPLVRMNAISVGGVAISGPSSAAASRRSRSPRTPGGS